MSTAIVPVRQGIPFVASRDMIGTDRALAADHLSVMRMLFAKAMAGKGERYGGKSAEQIVSNWSDDTNAVMLTRAATTPADTENSGLPMVTAVRLLPSLVPQAAANRVFAIAGLKLDFTRKYEFSIPYLAMMPEPVFVRENGAFPVVQGLIDSFMAGPTRKMGFMISASNELLAYDIVDDAFAIFRRLMTDKARISLDKAVFSNVAGSALRPPGLLFNVTALPPTAGGGLDALVGDLKKMAGAMADAAIDSTNAVIVTHPEQAETLETLPPQPLKHPVLRTAGVPVGTVIMIAPDAVVTGYEGDAQIYLSPDAAAHLDDNPQNISSPGSPNTISAPVLSSFQTDSEMLKVVIRCAWAAAPGGVQFVENVSW